VLLCKTSPIGHWSNRIFGQQVVDSTTSKSNLALMFFNLYTLLYCYECSNISPKMSCTRLQKHCCLQLGWSTASREVWLSTVTDKPAFVLHERMQKKSLWSRVMSITQTQVFLANISNLPHGHLV